MRLVILESILFGDLRPWMAVKKDRPVPGEPPEHRMQYRAWLTGLLEDYPETIAALKQGWDMEQEHVDKAEPFVQVYTELPFGRNTSFYYQLCMYESRRYLTNILSAIECLDNRLDQKFELNRIIRQLVDLLKEAQRLHETHDDELSQFVLQLVKTLCMQLILDLGLRYADWEDVDRYDEDTLYMGVLNEPVPERTSFFRTTAYRKASLVNVLSKEKPGPDLDELWAAVKADITRWSGSPLADSTVLNSHNRLLNHIENAAFLLCIEASFIGDTPENLFDAGYCREWVAGMKQDFVREKDMDASAELLVELSKAGACLEAMLPGIGSRDDHLTASSEAAALLSVFRQFSRQPFSPSGGAGRPAPAETPGSGSDFIPSFRERFIRLEEFDTALGINERTRARYLKDNNIRVLELTSNNKFLYREDVEAFLQQKTKK